MWQCILAVENWRKHRLMREVESQVVAVGIRQDGKPMSAPITTIRGIVICVTLPQQPALSKPQEDGLRKRGILN